MCNRKDAVYAYIDRATEEDKFRGIYHWAKLFKAKTWEEVKMLAGSNTFLEEAAETVFRLSEEEKIRMQCEAREDYYRQQRYIQKQLDKLKELQSCEQDMLANTAMLKERAATLQENNALLKVENETLLKSNEEKDAEIARLKLELSKKR